MTEPLTRTIHWRPDLPITLTESGSGPIALILHGGGGPFTVQSIAAHLSETMHVLLPTHPGWNGTERPAWLTTIPELARVYIQLLKSQGYRDVVVIGSSVGGWVACEMALHDDAHLLTGLVIIDPAGVQVEGQPIRDFYTLTPREVAEYSYHDPDRFYVDPATLPPEQVARQRANVATMRIFAGDHLYDPTLLARVGQIQLPTLVLWGDSDRIVTPAYGRAFAAAIPQARFTLVTDAGHLPHFEQPQATFDALDAFVVHR
ncbi:MAG TPA: alpha/beta hydrolase [Ktedonobacterales bacterium]|nr:alpha/beta hydrolase [Ktedonobacterales bacterium]